MKQIKNTIYEKFNTKERIIASVEARARDDENEIKRLIKTCPKQTYTCTDSDYSDRMNNLFILQMSLECDLMSFALSYFMGIFTGLNSEEISFIQEHTLQSFVNAHTAWKEFLTDNGIKIKTMEKIVSEMRHPIVASMLETSLVEPDRKGIDACRKVLDQIYNKNL